MKNDILVIKPKKAKGRMDTKFSQSESGKKLLHRLIIFLPKQDIAVMNGLGFFWHMLWISV